MTTPPKTQPTRPGRARRSVRRALLGRGAGEPDLLGSEASFAPPVGPNLGPADDPRGYYIDFSEKATDPAWPPDWLPGSPDDELHVATVQWALGAWERYLSGEGEAWLAAATRAADHLIELQCRIGANAGAWLHWFPMPHTYTIRAPWASGIAQGEAASLMVRLHAETGEERFAEAARLALRPMLTPKRDGGLLAEADGHPFFEEYPTWPDSLVLNGAIFALWGLYDVAEGLDDEEARRWYERGVDGLAAIIGRFDTGSWSRYDLYPHPVRNLATGAYHLLHINQLWVLSRMSPRPEFDRVRERFEAYRESRARRAGAFVRKVGFRLVTPRNSLFAHRLPWNRRVHRRGGGADLIVLCYHAVADDWAPELSVTPEQLRMQVQTLLDRGYVPATTTGAVLGARHRKTFAVTFDDAYASVLSKGKPVLDELGVPGSVFVPTAFPDRREPMSWPGISQWAGGPHESELLPLSWEQLRDLADSGWEIGSHCRRHPRLTDVSDEDALEELEGSRRDIEERVGRPCRSLAYPYGDDDARVVRLAARAGYVAACSLAPPLTEDAPLAWPRIGVYGTDDQLRLRLKVAPLTRWLRRSHLGPLVRFGWRRLFLRGAHRGGD